MAEVVLVTGASGGIGQQVCLAFARRGAHVVLLGRSPERLEEVAAEVRTLGAGASVVVADVTDRDRVEAAVDAAVAEHGRLDVVVHAAMVAAYGRLDELPADVWDRTVAVGITGTANVARAALRRFRQQRGGTLVVVGSVLGQVTVPYMGAYVTAKWAIEGLTRVLQQETREAPGVRVVMVHPGAIRTPIYALAANHLGREGEPPPPVYRPERVAGAVLKAVDGHRRQIGVSIANPIMRLGFGAVPWVYDVVVGPAMRHFGLGGPIAPNDGNAFKSTEEVERERGLSRPDQAPDPLRR